MKGFVFLFLSVLASGLAHAGRPIARWDVIPYQMVTGVFKVGVVAFHEKAVKVEFSVFGKPRFTAEAPELNERTGVKEYVYNLPVKAFKDGLITVGAVVTAGEESYTLPDLPLYANARGKLTNGKVVWVDSVDGNEFAEGNEDSPVKTIKRGVAKAGDGGTVYLKPGSYTIKMVGGGLDRKYWTLVTTAPGVARNSVKVSGGRSGTEKLHLKGLNLYCDVADGYGTIVMGEGGKTMAWFEDCRFTNLKGRHVAMTVPFGNKLRAFVVGGLTTEMCMGPNCEILRGHAIKSISGTAFAGSDCLVANCTVEDVSPATPDNPPDFFNGFAVPPNWAGDVILYGVKGRDVKCHGLAGQQLCDSAFVNVSFEGSAGVNTYCRFSEGLENVMFDHVSAKGHHWLWMTAKNGRGNVKPNGVLMTGCEFGSMDGYEPLDGSAGIMLRNCTFEHAK